MNEFDVNTEPHSVQLEAVNDPRPRKLVTYLRKNYTTLDCGHRFAVRQKPRGGCKTCWNEFFQTAPDIAHGVSLILNSQDSSWKDKMLSNQGAEFLKQAKFFHQNQRQ